MSDGAQAGLPVATIATVEDLVGYVGAVAWIERPVRIHRLTLEAFDVSRASWTSMSIEGAD